jgi:NAD(P)H-dependent FMN reductase
MSNVAILVGSHRNDSQSAKIGNMIAEKLAEHKHCNSVTTVDLAHTPLPFWSEEYSGDEKQQIEQTKQLLQQADAYVVISPEWHGMVPSALKNLFLLYTNDVFAHKPALIASVSASVNGSYPVSELRSTTYKNSRICYLPEHLIFRNVGEIFNGESDKDNEEQAYLSERTDYCLDYLMLYSEALSNVRQNQPSSDEFENGM